MPTTRVITVRPPLIVTGSMTSVPNTPAFCVALSLAASRSARMSSHRPIVFGAANASISKLEAPKVMVAPSTWPVLRFALMRSWMPSRNGR